MGSNINDITFLTEEQVFGDKRLDVFNKIGTKAVITDFSILLGASVYDSNENYLNEGNSLEYRTYDWWTQTTKTVEGDNLYYPHTYVSSVRSDGTKGNFKVDARRGYVAARPAINLNSSSDFCSNAYRNSDDLLEVEYGEYPQTIVSEDLSKILENLYSNNSLNATGKKYTTDKNDYDMGGFNKRISFEYEFYGEKYIRFLANRQCSDKVLSDGRIIENGKSYWVKVEPIKWIIDEKQNVALSKRLLFSGFHYKNGIICRGNFEETDIKKFIDSCFSKEIFPSVLENKEIYNMINFNENELEKVSANIELLKTLRPLSYMAGKEYSEDLDKQIKDLEHHANVLEKSIENAYQQVGFTNSAEIKKR